MFAQRFSPLLTFDEMGQGMARLLGVTRALGQIAPFATAPPFPALNIWEDSDSLYAEAEVPGVTREDVEVYAVGNELTIKGRRQARQGENLSYHRQEREGGEFTRVVTLPVEVNADKVEATLKDGVLTVTLPKSEEAKPRKITVKAT